MLARLLIFKHQVTHKVARKNADKCDQKVIWNEFSVKTVGYTL